MYIKNHHLQVEYCQDEGEQLNEQLQFQLQEQIQSLVENYREEGLNHEEEQVN